jgi:hypothetical protein
LKREFWHLKRELILAFEKGVRPFEKEFCHLKREFWYLKRESAI